MTTAQRRRVVALARMMGTTPDRVRNVRIGDAEVWASTVQDEMRDARMRYAARKAGLE